MNTTNPNPQSAWPARVTANLMLALAGLCVLAAAAQYFFGDPPKGWAATDTVFVFLLGVIAFMLAPAGWVALRKQPDNRMGWLLLFFGILAPLDTFLELYAEAAYARAPGWLTAAAYWLYGWLWFPTLLCLLIYVPLFFPDGHLPGPRWRWPTLAVSLVLLLLVCTMAGIGLAAMSRAPLGTLASVSEDDMPAVFNWLGYAVPAFPLLSLAALVARFFRGSPAVRRQIKWFVLFAVAGLLVMMISLFAPDLSSRLIQLTSIALFVLGLALAILRGKLWDVDIVIRKTLVYSVLSALLAGVYFGLVVLLQRGLAALTGQSNSEVVTVLSTLAVAGAFLPLRNWVQNFIDKRFYRRKYNAEQAVARFAQEMRDAVTMDEVATKLMDAVEETIQPKKIVLYLPLEDEKKQQKPT